MKIRNYQIKTGEKTYIMGILNVTPDSFSDGGSYDSVRSAVKATKEMAENGADIIDVGGESTRPGYTPVSVEEEISRVVPVIEAIKKECEIPVSVDTYKYEVAKAALDAGADMINDIWGLKKEPRLAELAAQYDASICIMHNREEIVDDDGDIFLDNLKKELLDSVDIAISAGVKKESILIDPGVGFGKTYEQNLCILKNPESFVKLGFPTLLATSRKSVIGLATGFEVDDRDEATVATSVLAAKAGIDMVRVHDVRKNAHALKMADVLIR
ncbi:MAG: dihydropteroate synthase [Eubacterium sp.]|nr:dihydropteroate synthase [Eubacterium sp.]